MDSEPSQPGRQTMGTEHELALSFLVCLSDSVTLSENLLASPCLGPASPHEVIAVPNAPSAAAGLCRGFPHAHHELVVCVHQDVLLPSGWDRLVLDQYWHAERRFGPIGVAGVYGVGAVRAAPGQPLAVERMGRVRDRGRLLAERAELPTRAETLDELLLIVRRDTPLQLDPVLGFHLYGADLCLQARERGLAVVVLGALCHHNSRSLMLPESFFASAEVFARKWAGRLPVATPCAVFDRGGLVYLLGNAELETSLAYAEGLPLRRGGIEPGRSRHRSVPRGSGDLRSAARRGQGTTVVTPSGIAAQVGALDLWRPASGRSAARFDSDIYEGGTRARGGESPGRSPA